MTLRAWTCPECDTYHSTVDAVEIDADPRKLQIKCSACGGVETIPGVVA